MGYISDTVAVPQAAAKSMHRFVVVTVTVTVTVAVTLVAGCSSQLQGGLTPRPCDPGELECLEGGAIRVCNEHGSAWIETTCAADQTCVKGACDDRLNNDCPDVCKDIICTPGETFCGANSIFVYECDATGTAGCFDLSCASPPLDGVCFEGSCVSVCGARQKSYLGCEYFAADLDNAYVYCSGDPSGSFCDAYGQQYAVVISNPDPAQTAHVIISDGSLELEPSAAVSACLPPGQPDPPARFVAAAVIAPKGIQVFNLPPKDINGTVLGRLAYRVASNIPISVYQFNPLENVDVFSNDASMLMPTTAADKDYFIMTRPQFSDELRAFMTVIGVDDEPTQVTITTTASIYAGTVLHDLTTAADDETLAAIPKGATETFLLARFDVLNLEPDQYGADLTGTFVSADKPVVVYAGHEAANAPTPMVPCASNGVGVCLVDPTRACTTEADCGGDTCLPVGTGVCKNDAAYACGADRDCPNATCAITGMCADGSNRTCASDANCPVTCIPTGTCSDSSGRVCARPLDCLGEIPCCADHLEQQLFPVSTWGRDYLAVRSYPRGGEPDIWRLLAAENGTTVTLDPPVANVPPLGEGEWFELEAMGDFVITANKPLLVGQFLVGAHSRGAGIGDPAFILAVPVRQFRTSYVFLTPGDVEAGTGYAQNYVSIATKQGTEDLTLLDGKPVDGASIDAWTNLLPGLVRVAAIASSGWRAYRIPVGEGFHSLSCPETCSVMVHGYDDYVSYGYPGGLNLLECKDDGDCRYPRRLCNADFTCVECLADNDCVLVGKSVCNAANVCSF